MAISSHAVPLQDKIIQESERVLVGNTNRVWSLIHNRLGFPDRKT
jgi:hypothetical protein